MEVETREKLKELRKLEHQAKLLIRKMNRIETDWNKVKEQLEAQGKDITHTLGDVLSGWNKK